MNEVTLYNTCMELTSLSFLFVIDYGSTFDGETVFFV